MGNKFLFLFAALFAAFGLGPCAFGVATVTTSGTTCNTDASTIQAAGGHGSTVSLSSISDAVLQITVGSSYASAIYLGEGWFITCAHVLSLTGSNAYVTYSGTEYYASDIQQVSGADLVMFYVGSSLTSLPSVTLASGTSWMNDPQTQTLALAGYGGGSESYGTSSLYDYPYTSTVSGSSVDFVTQSGTTEVITGDSGGGAFYYDSFNKTWVLAGILELQMKSTDSSDTSFYTGCVNVASYTPEIKTIMSEAVPEPAAWALAGAGAAALWLLRRWRSTGWRAGCRAESAPLSPG